MIRTGDIDGKTMLKMAEVAAIEYDDDDVALHIRDLLEACFVEFGGPVGIAKRLYIEFSSANPGSQTRVKILDNIMRLLEKFDTSGRAVSDDISEEDVDRMEKELMRQNAEEEKNTEEVPAQEVS